jgi:hypothetical protein
VLFVAMLLLAEAGRRLGMTRRRQEGEREHVGLLTIEGAIFGLLGLLIAFTFSGAASRFEARRVLAVQEANAIGTAYLRLDLLPPAARPALQEKFRRYVEARLAAYRALPDRDASSSRAAEAATLQREIWTGAVAALPAAPAQSSLLLLPALNEMIDLTESRALAAQTHTPTVILVVLMALALFCSLLVGYGLAGGRPFSTILHMIGFVFVLAATIYVIIDLDYPRLGLIRVDFSDQALLDVRAAMK